jgi:hypothetical protein
VLVSEFKTKAKKMKETIVELLFCLLLAAAAFGWGMIYENRRFSNLEKKVLLQDQRTKAIDGRLVALEGKKK